METDQNAKNEIRGLIRMGKKTSEIINMNKWPVDVIKAIKSEELENNKKQDRKRVEGDAQMHMAAKRELHHQRFLDRMGIKDQVVAENLENIKTGDATFQAPAGQIGAETNQEAQGSNSEG